MPPFTAIDVVDAWAAHIKTCLFPWELDPQILDGTHAGSVVHRLIAKIERIQLGSPGHPSIPFSQQTMNESLQVAGDAAQICKLLQPGTGDRVVMMPTFELVLKLCATHHKVCQSGGGGGGWCDI